MGVFSNDMENYSIKVERKGKNNNMLYDVMIYNHADNQGNVNVSISDSGKMEITQDKKFMSITLYNGQNYTERNRKPAKYSQTISFSARIVSERGY